MFEIATEKAVLMLSTSDSTRPMVISQTGKHFFQVILLKPLILR